LLEESESYHNSEAVRLLFVKMVDASVTLEESGLRETRRR
jgi:hypothetical protein